MTTSEMQDTKLEIRDKRGGFFWAAHAVVDDYMPLIGATGFALYMLLCHYADKNGQCFPSLQTLADKLGVSKPTVITYLDIISAVKLIAIERRPQENGDNQPNLYTLLDVPPSKPDLPPSKTSLLPLVKPVDSNKNQLNDSVSSKDETADESKPAVQKQAEKPSAPASEKRPANAADSAISTRKDELLPGTALQTLLDGMDDKDRLPAGFDFKPYMRLMKKLIKDGWTVDDFRKAGKIIRRWNDANGSPMYPAAAGDFIILIKEALGLVKRGFKSREIEAYVRTEKQQDFWRGKQMSLTYVAKNIKATAVPPVTETAEQMQRRINAIPIDNSNRYIAPNGVLL